MRFLPRLLLLALGLAAGVTATFTPLAPDPSQPASDGAFAEERWDTVDPRIRHIEPLSSFSLTPQGALQGAGSRTRSTASFATMSTTSPASTAATSEDSDVLATPYGLVLDLRFSAFAEEFNYTLSLHSTGFTPATKVTALRSDGSTAQSYTPPARSYKASFTDANGNPGYALATVLEDGSSADIAVFRDGELYHAQPASRYATFASARALHTDKSKGEGKKKGKGRGRRARRVGTLQTQSLGSGGAGLAVHRLTDIEPLDSQGRAYELCGGVQIASDPGSGTGNGSSASGAGVSMTMGDTDAGARPAPVSDGGSGPAPLRPARSARPAAFSRAVAAADATAAASVTDDLDHGDMGEALGEHHVHLHPLRASSFTFFSSSSSRPAASSMTASPASAAAAPTTPAAPGARAPLLARWSSCFPGGPRRLHVGFALDHGSFLSLGGTLAAAEAHVAAIVAQTNAVYEQQLGITLTVGEIVVMTEPGGVETPWNAGAPRPNSSGSGSGSGSGAGSGAGAGAGAGATGAGVSPHSSRPHTCPRGSAGPQQLLTLFSRWRHRARPGRLGLWHLLTSCFPPPGTVGLAFMGSTCLSAASVGWSHMGSTAWLTVAHEIGHSLGAAHTFQRGRGRTGGLMDYGDGRIPASGSGSGSGTGSGSGAGAGSGADAGAGGGDGGGEYGFLTEYTKPLICSHVTASLAGSNAIFSGSTRIEPVSECWSTFAPRCGDGIVEGDEECDAGPLGNRCCTPHCTLAPGATCARDGGNGDGNECCVDCRAQPATVACNVGSDYTGYCGPKGECRPSECRGFSNTRFCGGFLPENTCQEMCAFVDDAEHPEQCQEVTSDDMSLASGSHCVLTPAGSSNNNNSSSSNSGNGTVSNALLPSSSAPVIGRCQRPTVDSRAVCMPVSLSWRAGAWGPCGCDGRQRRRVLCAEADGTLVAADLCRKYASVGAKEDEEDGGMGVVASGEMPAEERECTLERGQAAVCGTAPTDAMGAAVMEAPEAEVI